MSVTAKVLSGTYHSSKQSDSKEQQHSPLAVMESDELELIAGCSSWLLSLMSAMETLPVSFSLASASEDRPGFPLIYVNKRFEETSGTQ
jgi:hypothetical protein